jgi:HEAT repeat protein
VVALGALNELGEQSREVRPASLKLTSDADPFVRATALSALVSTGGETGATLKKIEAAMRDSAPIVRLSAVTAAGTMGPDAKGLAGQITVMFDDADPGVRIAVIRAAGAVGGNDPKLVARLVARLDDPASMSAALEALARLGADSSLAASKLVALYPKVGKPERLAILNALGASAGSSSGEVIASGLKDADPAVRSAALHAHVKTHAVVADSLSVLVSALQDSQVSVRRTAAGLLGQIGDKEVEKVVPALLPLIALLESSEDRQFALEALRLMHVRDEAALAKALELRVVEARAWACERAMKLGKKGRPLVDKLRPLLADRDDYVRRAARKALEQIER